jgi:glycosyl transferase family 25
VAHCFVINLDRVPERWRFMQEGLRAAGLEPERFPAVDAARPEALADAHYRAHSGDRWELPHSLVACFESHRRAWQTIVDRGLPMAVVFEDDVVPGERLGDAIDWLDRGGVAFDVAKLDTARRSLRMGPVMAEAEGLAFRALLSGGASAAAYAVSREGAAKLLEWSDPFCDHTDDFVFRPRPGFRVLQLMPAAAIQAMFLSGEERAAIGLTDPAIIGSERSSDSRLNRKTNRGPLWFRARKELRRSARKLVRGLFADRALKARGGLIGLVEFTAPRR